MASNILVAMDESKNAMRAVKYVARAVRSDARITLLSILPDPTAACGLDGPSLSPLFKENRQAFCSIEDKKRLAVQDSLGRAKEALIKAGFTAKDIQTKVRKKKSGIARDILKEAAGGNYDTIVVGRKGLSGVKEFLMGSVPSKILSNAAGMAVIVVN